jgi:hypothetical protein
MNFKNRTFDGFGKSLDNYHELADSPLQLLSLGDQSHALTELLRLSRTSFYFRNPSLPPVTSPIPRPTSLTPLPPRLAAPVILPPSLSASGLPCGPRGLAHVTPRPGARSRDSPRLPLDTLSRLPWPRSTILPWAPHLRNPHAIMPALFTCPAWSPRIAEPLSTPRGAAASIQRPSALLPAHADAPTLRSRGPSPTARAPQTKSQLWTCQGCTKPPCNFGARQWHHSQTLPGVQAPTGTKEDVSAR